MSKSPKATKPAASKPKPTLPATIVNALPSAAKIMGRMAEIDKLVASIDKEMAKAIKSGTIPASRAFVAYHRMLSRIDAITKPLAENFDKYKKEKMPELFEREGVTHIPLAEGFRVGLSSRLFASIVAEEREAAFQWLRANGLGDLIVGTVNAQTLSAAAKKMMEEEARELPDKFFKVAYVPNTSVTAT